MKKTTLLISLLFMFNGCKYFIGDNCNNTKPIVGVYKNTYDSRAKNILIIKEDGTYIQEYSKKGISKKNQGTWRFLKESCNVYLEDLKLLHEVPKQYKDFFKKSGIYRLNRIMFVEDFPFEFDYYKVK